MTIQTEATKIVHDGTGSQDTFTFNFIVIDENDLSVYEDNDLTVRAYTLSGEGDPAGGEIVFDSELDVPLAGTKVTLIREGEYKQETDYTAYGPFPAETHETTLDKIVILVQQVKELIDRAFRLPKWDVTSPFEVTREVGDDIEETVLGYDVNGILTLMPISEQFIDAGIPNPLEAINVDISGTLRFDGAGAAPTAFTGADAKIVTGTKGDASDFAMWNADGDIIGSGVAGPEVGQLAVAAEWAKAQNFNEAAITSTSNATAWNVEDAQCSVHVLTENTTISAPSNLKAGGTYILRVVQAAGVYSLAWNAVFEWGEADTPAAPAADGDVVIFSFYSDGATLYGIESIRVEA